MGGTKKYHNVAEFWERKGIFSKAVEGRERGEFWAKISRKSFGRKISLPFVTKILPVMTFGLDKFKFCGII